MPKKKRLTATEERERFVKSFSISKDVFKSNYDPKDENGGRHVVVGLDVSNARTGVCIMSIANPDLIKITSIKPKGKTRYQRIADTIDQLHAIIPTNTLFVAYENYAFGGPKQGMSNMTSIAELGGIVRWHLRNLGLQILHVSPTQLKKWILKN